MKMSPRTIGFIRSGRKGMPRGPTLGQKVTFSCFFWLFLDFTENKWKVGKCEEKHWNFTFPAVLGGIDPPRNLKKPLVLQWFRGGAAERRNFPPKRWLLVPRGVFFGDFHEKTMISSLFPTFGERGTFPPPPTQNLAMVMLFQWFWGVQFHPNREIMLFQLFPNIFIIFMFSHFFIYFHPRWICLWNQWNLDEIPWHLAYSRNLTNLMEFS